MERPENKVGPDTPECPSCGGNWKGGEIPEPDRHLFGGKTHFSLLYGLYDLRCDRTVAWQCPHCKEEWPRE